MFLESLEQRSLMATLTWVGDQDLNWATNNTGNTNWSGDALPASGDTLIFAGAAVGTLNNNTAANNVYGLQFTAGGYTVTGAAINLNPAATPGSPGFAIQNTAGNNTVNTPLVLAGADNTLDVTAGVLTTNGLISGGAGNALTKTGAGTYTAAVNSSTYTGAVNINTGTLNITAGHNDANANGAIGNTNVARNINVATGATLQLSAHDVFGSVAVTPAATLNINGTVSANGFFSTLGPIVMNGGLLRSFAGSGNTSFETYRLNGSVTVTGSTPSTILATGPTSGIHLAANTTFDVADVTGNAGTDLFVNAQLLNQTGANFGGAAATLTKNGAGTLSLGNVNTYSGGTVINAGTVRLGGLADSLVAYYAFDSLATLNVDSSGRGNNLTATGTPVFNGAGKFGGALSMDGTANFLGQGGSFPSMVPIGGSSYTISAWMNSEAVGNLGIVGWGNYGTNNQVNAFRTNGDTQLNNYWWGADLTVNTPNSTSLSAGSTPTGWHHVTATYDALLGARRIYVDGVLAGAQTIGAPNVQPVNFRLGSTNFGEYFNGLLDDIAIFNRTLTADEVLALSTQSVATATNITTSFLADNGTVTINGTGALDLNNSNETIGGLAGAAGATVAMGSGTLTINQVSADTNFAGVISGTGGLVKAGTGRQILSGANTYSGTTTIQNGILQAANNSALGTTASGTVVTPPVPSGLTHRYSFNESGPAGTSLLDSVGTAHGTIVDVGANNATVGGGQVTLAGGAQAASDYVSFPSGLVSSLTDATLEFWTTQISVQNWSRIFDFGANTSNYLMMAFTQGTNLGSSLVEWRGNFANGVTNPPNTLGVEQHVVMTIDQNWNGGAQTLVSWYKNGVFVASAFTAATLSALTDTNVWLGRSQFGDNTANASYNEFRIYNRALSGAEIVADYNAGANPPAGALALDGNITITGETLTIAGPGDASQGALRNRSGANTFVGTVNLAGAATIGSEAGTLTIDPTAGNAVTGVNLALTLTGSGNIAVNDPINLGTASLTKTGGGTATLGVNNTYDGVTKILGGTLTASAPNALGSTTNGTTVGTAVAPAYRYSFDGVGGTGTTIYDSIGGADGVIRGTDTSRLTGQGQLQLQGGGSGTAGYVDLPNGMLAGLTGVTFESWIRWNGGADWQRLFDFGTNTVGEINAPGGAFNGTRYIFLSPRSGSGGNPYYFELNAGGAQTATATTLAANTALHVAMTFDDATNTAALYVNGVQVGINTAVTNVLANVGDVNNWIGRSNWSADPNFGGQIDEFRIYKRALSAGELSASFTAGANAELGSGTLGLSGGVTVAENIDLNGTGRNGFGALQNLGGNNVLSGGTVNLNSTTGIGVSAGQLTITAPISGGGDWSKFGPNELLLDGNNTFTGNTTVVSGTLAAASNNALGSTAGTTTVTSAQTPKNRYSFNGAGGIGAVLTDSVGGQNGVLRGADASALSGTGRLNLSGGSSATAGYGDLPNGLISGLTAATFETWLTWNGGGQWQRILDFGSNTAGEVTAPGGTFTGDGANSYVFLTPNSGANTYQGARS